MREERDKLRKELLRQKKKNLRKQTKIKSQHLLDKLRNSQFIQIANDGKIRRFLVRKAGSEEKS